MIVVEGNVSGELCFLHYGVQKLRIPGTPCDVPPEKLDRSRLEVRSLLTALLGPRSGDEEVSVF
jgi:hypothetical protein